MTKLQTGCVHWLDKRDGDGMIKSNDGHLYYVHKTAFKSLDNVSDGVQVKFRLLDDVTFQQVEYAEVIQ